MVSLRFLIVAAGIPALASTLWAQGSEYPAVVIPLHTQHYLMLSRNLIYTALTRAKKTVVLIGTTKAIGMAMSNLEATHRFTGLARELNG